MTMTATSRDMQQTKITKHFEETSLR